MTARCGRVMRRYEAVHGALPEAPECGRPAGHNGPCRTVQAMAREAPKEAARLRARRFRAWLEANMPEQWQADNRAALEAALAGGGLQTWRERMRPGSAA